MSMPLFHCPKCHGDSTSISTSRFQSLAALRRHVLDRHNFDSASNTGYTGVTSKQSTDRGFNQSCQLTVLKPDSSLTNRSANNVSQVQPSTFNQLRYEASCQSSLRNLSVDHVVKDVYTQLKVLRDSTDIQLSSKTLQIKHLMEQLQMKEQTLRTARQELNELNENRMQLEEKHTKLKERMRENKERQQQQESSELTPELVKEETKSDYESSELLLVKRQYEARISALEYVIQCNKESVKRKHRDLEKLTEFVRSASAIEVIGRRKLEDYIANLIHRVENAEARLAAQVDIGILPERRGRDTAEYVGSDLTRYDYDDSRRYETSYNDSTSERRGVEEIGRQKLEDYIARLIERAEVAETKLADIEGGVEHVLNVTKINHFMNDVVDDYIGEDVNSENEKSRREVLDGDVREEEKDIYLDRGTTADNMSQSSVYEQRHMIGSPSDKTFKDAQDIGISLSRMQDEGMVFSCVKNDEYYKPPMFEDYFSRNHSRTDPNAPPINLDANPNPENMRHQCSNMSYANSLQPFMDESLTRRTNKLEIIAQGNFASDPNGRPVTTKREELLKNFNNCRYHFQMKSGNNFSSNDSRADISQENSLFFTKTDDIVTSNNRPSAGKPLVSELDTDNFVDGKHLNDKRVHRNKIEHSSLRTTSRITPVSTAESEIVAGVHEGTEFLVSKCERDTKVISRDDSTTGSRVEMSTAAVAGDEIPALTPTERNERATFEQKNLDLGPFVKDAQQLSDPLLQILQSSQWNGQKQETSQGEKIEIVEPDEILPFSGSEVDHSSVQVKTVQQVPMSQVTQDGGDHRDLLVENEDVVSTPGVDYSQMSSKNTAVTSVAEDRQRFSKDAAVMSEAAADRNDVSSKGAAVVSEVAADYSYMSSKETALVSESSGDKKYILTDDQNVIPDAAAAHYTPMYSKNTAAVMAEAEPADSHIFRRYQAVMSKDVLFLVCKYLDSHTLSQISSVCHDWLDVTRQPSLWVELNFTGIQLSLKFLTTISSWCTKVCSITFKEIRGRSRVDDVETDEEYIESIRGCLEPGFEALITASQDTISSIAIINCDDVLTDRCLWPVSCFCRLLRQLTYISSLDPAGPEVIWALGTGCRDVTKASIVPRYPSKHPEKFNNKCVLIIARFWASLVRLSLGGTDIDTTGLAAISQNCSLLERLDLDHVRPIDAQVAELICDNGGFKNLCNLRCIYTIITREAVLHIDSSCVNLKVLDIHWTLADSNGNMDDLKWLTQRETIDDVIKMVDQMKLLAETADLKTKLNLVIH